VIVRAVRRDKNTPQRLGKRRKEKEAKKKIENKDKKGQKGSVFADLCRFICINKKKVVPLHAICARTRARYYVQRKTNTE